MSFDCLSPFSILNHCVVALIFPSSQQGLTCLVKAAKPPSTKRALTICLYCMVSLGKYKYALQHHHLIVAGVSSRLKNTWVGWFNKGIFVCPLIFLHPLIWLTSIFCFTEKCFCFVEWTIKSYYMTHKKQGIFQCNPVQFNNTLNYSLWNDQ